MTAWPGLPLAHAQLAQQAADAEQHAARISARHGDDGLIAARAGLQHVAFGAGRGGGGQSARDVARAPLQARGGADGDDGTGADPAFHLGAERQLDQRALLDFLDEDAERGLFLERGRGGADDDGLTEVEERRDRFL